MRDIIDRLRSASLSLPGARECGLSGNVCDEAADEIERLSDALAEERRISAATADALIKAEAERNAALSLVANLRAALGDNGKRMQPELIAYAAELLASKVTP